VVEAQQRLPELLSAVEAGEVVEIRAENGRNYRLAPSRPRPPVTGVPKAGRLKGLLVVPDDFNEPLDELRGYMGPAPVVDPAWPGYPHPGSARGLIAIHDDFDEPLDEIGARP
jgi:antitoxin (DNA-binding transcriptional repressor) of toxin-antitoxin stability system